MVSPYRMLSPYRHPLVGRCIGPTGSFGPGLLRCTHRDRVGSKANETALIEEGGQGIAAFSGLTRYPSRRCNPGSLAKFAAMRRASSRVSSLAAERRPGSFSK